MQVVEGRYSWRLAAGQLTLVALFAALVLVLGYSLDVFLLFMAGALALIPLSRLVDRRVKLRADASGLRYRRFGPRTFPWSEFVRFHLQTLHGRTRVVLTPRDAQQFAQDLPWYRRSVWLSWYSGAPEISVNDLDLPLEQLFAVLGQHIDAATTPERVHAAAGADPLDIVLPVADARMPAACLGCRGRPTGHSRIEARPGFEPGWFSVSASVGILAPTCTACRWKRYLLGLVFAPVPFAVWALGVYVMIRLEVWPLALDVASWMIMFVVVCAVIALWEVVVHVCIRLADRLMWGVHATRIAKDRSRLVLRVQSAALREELLELNLPARAP